MLTKDIEENFPFLSVVTYGGNEYVGVIINQDATVTSMYIYTDIKTPQEQQAFLELGEIWWWESNRSIPINIFLKQDWEQFRPFLKTFINKDLQILLGPSTSLQELSRKKIKRRSITLVRRVD